MSPPISLNSVNVLFHSVFVNLSWKNAAVIGYGGPKGELFELRRIAKRIQMNFDMKDKALLFVIFHNILFNSKKWFYPKLSELDICVKTNVYTSEGNHNDLPFPSNNIPT